MPLIPENFIVPEKLVTPKFVFRKLCYADAELDYVAVMSSIDIIKKTRGGSWPTADLSYVDDQIDLAWHQREFENRTSFAYTIMTPQDDKCLGCLYLYPPGYRGPRSQNSDVDVSFWVTQEAYNQGMYPAVYQALNDWLKTSWPFKNICFTNVE
jgi:RimJ/RimL family protein N-acetyltransferase